MAGTRTGGSAGIRTRGCSSTRARLGRGVVAGVSAFSGRGIHCAARLGALGCPDDDGLLGGVRDGSTLGVLDGDKAEAAVALGSVPEDPFEIGARDDLADGDFFSVFQGHQAVDGAGILAAYGSDADELRRVLGASAIEDGRANGLVLVGPIVQGLGMGRIGTVSRARGRCRVAGGSNRSTRTTRSARVYCRPLSACCTDMSSISTGMRARSRVCARTGACSGTCTCTGASTGTGSCTRAGRCI